MPEQQFGVGTEKIDFLPVDLLNWKQPTASLEQQNAERNSDVVPKEIHGSPGMGIPLTFLPLALVV